MTSTVYCRQWNNLTFAPREPITEAAARRRFEKGPWFSVVFLRDDGTPDSALELQPWAAHARVTHFTAAGSAELVLDFSDIDGRLFVNQLTAYVYADDERHVRLGDSVEHDTFAFEPDGVVRRIRNDKSQPQIEVEDRAGVDVSRHWLPLPAFGEWEPLLTWRDG